MLETTREGYYEQYTNTNIRDRELICVHQLKGFYYI